MATQANALSHLVDIIVISLFVPQNIIILINQFNIVKLTKISADNNFFILFAKLEILK